MRFLLKLFAWKALLFSALMAALSACGGGVPPKLDYRDLTDNDTCHQDFDYGTGGTLIIDSICGGSWVTLGAANRALQESGELIFNVRVVNFTGDKDLYYGGEPVTFTLAAEKNVKFKKGDMEIAAFSGDEIQTVLAEGKSSGAWAAFGQVLATTAQLAGSGSIPGLEATSSADFQALSTLNQSAYDLEASSAEAAAAVAAANAEIDQQMAVTDGQYLHNARLRPSAPGDFSQHVLGQVHLGFNDDLAVGDEFEVIVTISEVGDTHVFKIKIV